MSLRFAFLGALALACVFVPGAVRADDSAAEAAAKARLSATVLDWCGANYSKFKAVIAESKKTPDVPNPPQIDPPCYECNGTTPGKSNADTQVAGWISYTMEPENTDLPFLLGISRQRALFAGDEASLMSPDAVACFKQFDQSTVDGAIQRMIDHLLNVKAHGMFDQFGTDRTRAYAGIQLLLKVSRLVTLLQGEGDHDVNADQPVDDARSWLSKVTDNLDKDVFQNHKFNLCPSYTSLFRELELLNGQGIDASQIVDKVQKMNDALHFDIDMQMHEIGPAQNGGKLDVTWGLTGTMELDLNPGKGCYTPKLDNNNDLAVTVKDFTLIGTDGTHVALASPKNFNTPIATFDLAICDNQPLMKLHVTSFGPPDAVQAKGGEAKSGFFQGAWGAAVNAPLNSAIASAVGAGGGSTTGDGVDNASGGDASNGGNGSSSGNSQMSLPSPSPSPSPRSSPTASAQMTAIKNKMNALKAQLEAHKNDPQWLMGPQGQAVIAQMTAAAQQATVAAGNSIGPGVGQALAKADTLELTWNNGTATPVNEQFNFHAQGFVETLKVTVTQHPRH